MGHVAAMGNWIYSLISRKRGERKGALLISKSRAPEQLFTDGQP